MTFSIAKKFLGFFGALALLLSASLTQANHLTASVDRDKIGLDETLNLIVTADEGSRSAPDFSALKSDFEILSTSRSQSIRIINGHTESSTEWNIALAPKRMGRLLIPSFSLEGAVSDAIEIQVDKQSPQQQDDGGQQMVRATLEVEKKSAYVQEQILVKVKLLTQVSLSQAQADPLEIKNALVIPLSEQPVQYQTTINGKPHLVLETTYAVFPQDSGELLIPSMIYSVVPNSSRDIWDAFNHRGSNILRLHTQEEVINVKPAPDKNVVQNWQPATKFTINEGWSSNIDQAKVGEPITRTITLVAEGLSGGQIAPLPSLNIDGLTLYPDQAQTKDNKTTRGIQGARTETLAIVPTHGGDFTLPEINVEWWDTNSQSMKTASLPGKTIHVIGDAKPQATASSEAASDASTKTTPEIAAPDVKIQTSPWLWATTILFVILSALLGVYVWTLRKRIAQLEADQATAEAIISEKENTIWDVLKHAAANKDAAALRKAVLGWAQFQWPNASVHSLDEVAKLANKPELTQALKALDEVLYSNHTVGTWDPNNLLQLLNECRKEKNKTKKSEGLKPLYNN